MKEAVIVSAARTAIGKYGKTFTGIKATELGAHAISAALERSGLDAGMVEDCIMGNVLSSGLGQNPARQAAVGGGLPVEIGATTINMVCGSGLKAAMFAADSIKAGEFNAVMVGGLESMSNAPYLMNGARWGYRMNDQKVVDSMVHDGLWDIFNDMHMGNTGEIVAERFDVSREEADEFSYKSHLRAAAAIENGGFKDEIVPYVIKGRKGDTVVDTDEGVRADTSMEALAKLKPIFKKDGVVTPGNSSQLSDGAAALLITSREFAEEHSLPVMASIVSYGTKGLAPELIMEAPIPATEHVLHKAGMTVDDIDLFEHNEAFATASIAVMKGLGIEEDRFNVNGGAIALGHPIGASGARVLTSLVHALKERGKENGLATLCLGGGNAVTMIVRSE